MKCVASLIHEAHTTPLLRVWLTLSTAVSRNVFWYYCSSRVRLLIH